MLTRIVPAVHSTVLTCIGWRNLAISVTRLLGEEVLSVSVSFISWGPSIKDRHCVARVGGDTGSPFTVKLLDVPGSGSTSSNGLLLEFASNLDLLSSCLSSSSIEN